MFSRKFKGHLKQGNNFEFKCGSEDFSKYTHIHAYMTIFSLIKGFPNAFYTTQIVLSTQQKEIRVWHYNLSQLLEAGKVLELRRIPPTFLNQNTQWLYSKYPSLSSQISVAVTPHQRSSIYNRWRLLLNAATGQSV